MVCICI